MLAYLMLLVYLDVEGRECATISDQKTEESLKAEVDPMSSRVFGLVEGQLEK